MLLQPQHMHEHTHLPQASLIGSFDTESNASMAGYVRNCAHLIQRFRNENILIGVFHFASLIVDLPCMRAFTLGIILIQHFRSHAKLHAPNTTLP